MDKIDICTIIPPLDENDPEVAAVQSNAVSSEQTELAMDPTLLWPKGKTLLITFLDGSPYLRHEVETHARRWLKYAYLDMKFGDHFRADIRISFEEEGSWSLLGKMCLKRKDQTQPTMNFGYLSDDTPEEEIARTVLHEFGHALGCIHEHQSPRALGKIPWDEPAVYNWYRKKLGWRPEKTKANILDYYQTDRNNASTFDDKSIMLYPISGEHTRGRYVVRPNSVLSETDKRFIAKAYPRPPPKRSWDTTYGADFGNAPLGRSSTMPF